MRRREFLRALGGLTVAWPAMGRAQSNLPVVGLLGAPSRALYGKYLAAMLQGLQEAGFVEGKNVTIEHRWADGQYDRLPSMAADLSARQVQVICTVGGAPAAFAAKAATPTIPIVFVVAEDPVKLGLVNTFSTPGGNATGVSILTIELEGKRLEIIREVMPQARRIAILLNPKNPQSTLQLPAIESTAQRLGLQVQALRASTEAEIDAAYAEAIAQRADALIIGADGFLLSRREQIVGLSARHALPTIYRYRDECALGGLMSYGTDLADAYRLEGTYVGRVLKGEAPGTLPVQQSTKVELIINLKTAKTLGLSFPLTMLGRADEVIE
jgi:putative tryptophan/tyrosine transport system substrate-binding protein